MEVKEMSTVTGQMEICTVRPGVMGADGIRRGAIPDLDLIEVFQDVINTKNVHYKGVISMELNVRGGDIVPKKNPDKHFRRKIKTYKESGTRLAVLQQIETDRQNKLNEYIAEGKQTVEDDEIVMPNKTDWKRLMEAINTGNPVKVRKEK